MTLSKYKDLATLNNIRDIDEEILNLQKKLFKLRAKQSVNQAIKPHLFSHLKRKIAQLNFKKSAEIKS